jgi:F420-dependent oxidoreductase-like protein
MSMELCLFTEPQEGASYEQLLRLAQACERHGLTGFFRSDHIMMIGQRSGLPGPTDAWVTLAGLARETSRIRLGTLVTPTTFRHPSMLAISVAQVDAMSHGRVELGIGAGWYGREHEAHGIEFPPVPGRRMDRMADTLAILAGMWTTPVGERFSYTGKVWQLKDCPALPKPVQSPHPPIVIGGGGAQRTPALTARYAAEFNMGFAPEENVTPRFDVIRAACEKIGRDPATLKLSSALVVCCARTPQEVARKADNLKLTLNMPRERWLIGTPPEVVEKILRYRALGASRMYVQYLDFDDTETIQLLGEEVLPHI